MTSLDIAFSTCPNDTFSFHALLHDCVDTGDLRFVPHLHDVEALNQRAFERRYHVTKLSFYAYLKLRQAYTILDAGAALGYGCGPLLVARPGTRLTPAARIAIPGHLTTAYLLLRLWNPALANVEATRFDNILGGVRDGRYDAGLIIHEGRFIYPQYGCEQVVDLGAWWEAETGLPIPLGCIAIRSDSPWGDLKGPVEAALAASIAYAFEHRAASRAYVKAHAQEMADDVIDGHIDLYVNPFSLSLGDAGREAVQALEERALWQQIL